MRWSVEEGKKKGRAPMRDQLQLLAAEPRTEAGVMVCARAYAELATCRSIIAGPTGIAMGPIPWTAMVVWCERHDLDDHVADHLITVLRLVDKQMIARFAAKMKHRGRR